MTAQRPAEQPTIPAAIVRLDALSPLDDRALQALQAAADRPRQLRAKREFLAEGQEITEPLLVLSGWAARQRILADGRRQIVDFLLPGDLIGVCDHDRPVSLTSAVALTGVEVCVAPSRRP